MRIWAAVKYALNSTLGTNEFTPLDVLIKNAVVGGIEEYISFGSYTFTVPAGVTKIKVTACGAGAGGNRSLVSAGTTLAGIPALNRIVFHTATLRAYKPIGKA